MKETDYIEQGRGLMSMNDVDLLSDADLPQDTHQKHEGGEGVLGGKR